VVKTDSSGAGLLSRAAVFSGRFALAVFTVELPRGSLMPGIITFSPEFVFFKVISFVLFSIFAELAV
jgi:hypothetical protein